MTASDPYDVQGLLRALQKVRPDLAPVLRTAREAHSGRKAGVPRSVLKAWARKRAQRQSRCSRGHFAAYLTDCKVCGEWIG